MRITHDDRQQYLSVDSELCYQSYIESYQLTIFVSSSAELQLKEI